MKRSIYSGKRGERKKEWSLFLTVGWGIGRQLSLSWFYYGMVGSEFNYG